MDNIDQRWPIIWAAHWTEPHDDESDHAYQGFSFKNKNVFLKKNVCAWSKPFIYSRSFEWTDLSLIWVGQSHPGAYVSSRMDEAK